MDNGETKPQAPFHGYDFDYQAQRPVPYRASNNRNQDRADGPLSMVTVFFSTIVLGIALISGAYVAAQVIWKDNENFKENIVPILGIVGLTYIVGWVVALVGLRTLDTLFILPLPYVIRMYTWGTLGGILLLYFIVMQKFYWQVYNETSFVKYVLVMAAAFGALLGFHLLVKGHSLRPLSIPLLIFVVIHMALIVFHYVFAEALDTLNGRPVDYYKLIYELLFFFGMVGITGFMAAQLGVLSGIRNSIDRVFEKK